jgi:hypothetical protein
VPLPSCYAHPSERISCRRRRSIITSITGGALPGAQAGVSRSAGDRIDATYYSAVTGTPYQMTGEPAVRLPFQTLNPLPTVSGSVNGSPLRFVLDTGATFGLSAAAATAAGVQPVATVQTLTPDGPVESYVGVAGSLMLGGIEIRNIPVMWNATSLLDAPAGAAGVLGTTIFYHFLTTVDWAGCALVVQQKTSTSAQSRASAIFSGGSVSRVAGLNAQENSACRSTLPSGAPGSFAERANRRSCARAGLGGGRRTRRRWRRPRRDRSGLACRGPGRR